MSAAQDVATRRQYLWRTMARHAQAATQANRAMHIGTGRMGEPERTFCGWAWDDLQRRGHLGEWHGMMYRSAAEQHILEHALDAEMPSSIGLRTECWLCADCVEAMLRECILARGTAGRWHYSDEVMRDDERYEGWWRERHLDSDDDSQPRKDRTHKPRHVRFSFGHE